MAGAEHPDLKRAILEVSVQLGSELGEEGLTMRGIANRLGVSATSLYQHFDSKSAILRAIRFWGLERLNEYLAPAFEIDDPTERLVEQGKRYVGFARDNAWLYCVLVEGEQEDWTKLSADERDAVRISGDKVREAMQDGIDSGLLRSDIDLRTAPFFLWAACHGLASLMIRGRVSERHPEFPIDDDTAIDGFIREIVGVLRGGGVVPPAGG